MTQTDAFAQVGKLAVQQNIQGTLAFLQQYPPFQQMQNAHLAYLVEHCQLRFYAKDDLIISPADGPVAHFYIVKQGRIRGQRRTAQGAEADSTFEIASGECFPLAALMAERETHTTHLAAEDSFCLLLSKAAFTTLLSQSAPLRDFALRGVSSLLEQVNRQVQLQAAQSLGADYSLDTPLAQLIMQKPVCCAPSSSLQQAVQLMHERHVGSIIITDPQQRPLGIFTLRDLRRVIGEGALDLQQPIAQLMTPSPFHLPPHASAFDAALAMTERHIAHVCVVEQGQLQGVLSERDLFSLQRMDLVHLAQTIRHAPSLQTLISLRHTIHKLVEQMLAHGASSTQITYLITLLNDHTLTRVIELALQALGDPGIGFSWLCFGSEGRREQTLHTDQDNGLLFEAEDDNQAEAYRARLLPLAQRINQDLAQCGFAWCKGNIMASNPKLCLSRHEWTRRFQHIVRESNADNLLASSIYFDLRVVWGPTAGAEQLQQSLLQQIADAPLFQRMMAGNALRQRPPVGRLREFILNRQDDTLDLKVQGLTPFVDGARVLALAHGISVSNTLERLQQLVDQGILEAKDGAAYAEAYHFIQQTRLQQHQHQARSGLALSNALNPDQLNHLDRRILRESLRQAQRLQASLALRYQL